jgi:hypothetical protein
VLIVPESSDHEIACSGFDYTPTFHPSLKRVETLWYVIKSRLSLDLVPAIQEALSGYRFISPPLSRWSALALSHSR